jgi:CBS domain-containing protein
VPVSHVMSSRLVSVTPEATVKEAVELMVARGVGCVVVTDAERLAGIFTERDVLRLVAEGAKLGQTIIGDVMTRDVISVMPEDDPVDVAHLMSAKRIRHVPVAHDGHALGMVGIRDLLGLLLERAYGRQDTDARDTARDLLGRSPLSSAAPPGA